MRDKNAMSERKMKKERGCIKDMSSSIERRRDEQRRRIDMLKRSEYNHADRDRFPCSSEEISSESLENRKTMELIRTTH